MEDEKKWGMLGWEQVDQRKLGESKGCVGGGGYEKCLLFRSSRCPKNSTTEQKWCILTSCGYLLATFT